MQVFWSAAIHVPLPRRPVSAKTLRMWCAPEIIMGVTTLSDEQALLLHIIHQARQSGAKGAGGSCRPLLTLGLFRPSRLRGFSVPRQDPVSGLAGLRGGAEDRAIVTAQHSEP